MATTVASVPTTIAFLGWLHIRTFPCTSGIVGWSRRLLDRGFEGLAMGDYIGGSGRAFIGGAS